MGTSFTRWLSDPIGVRDGEFISGSGISSQPRGVFNSLRSSEKMRRADRFCLQFDEVERLFENRRFSTDARRTGRANHVSESRVQKIWFSTALRANDAGGICKDLRRT